MCLSKEEKNEQAKQRYHWLKEHHICVECGQEKARKNKTRCAECAAKNNESVYKNKLNWSIEDKQKHNEIAMNRYNKLKAMNICVQCGKRKAKKDRVFCEWCSRKKSLQAHNKYVLNAYENKESLSYIRV